MRTARTCLSLVNMVVIPLVRTTDCHDNEVFARVKTKVVHWWLQLLCIFSQPFVELEGRSERHGRWWYE